MVKLNTGAHPEEINNCLILPIVIPGFKSVGKKSRQCVNVLRSKMMLFAALMNGINDAVFQIENSIAVDLVELIRIFHMVILSALIPSGAMSCRSEYEVIHFILH